MPDETNKQPDAKTDATPQSQPTATNAPKGDVDVSSTTPGAATKGFEPAPSGDRQPEDNRRADTERETPQTNPEVSDAPEPGPSAEAKGYVGNQ